MRALVLGGVGFIGKHLCHKILQQSDDNAVVALDNLDTSRLAVTQEFAGYRPGSYVFIQEDHKTISEDLLLRLAENVDIIYHLAGSVGVELGDKEPKRTLYNNVELMMKIMPILEKAGKHVVFASTSEIYGNGPSFNENDPAGIGPSKYTRWGYSTTKLLSEFMLRVSGLPHNIIRFFNIVGPGQLPDYGMVLPRFVDAVKNDRSPIVHGDGSQIRSFCHIDDAVEMVLRVHEHPGELFNIGNSDNAISMRDLAHKVIEVAGSDVLVDYAGYGDVFSERFEDIMYRVPDTTKIRSMTGYEPKYTLEDIIKDVL